MKKFFLIFATLFITLVHAKEVQSMRRCALLPVTDGVSGALGNRVFRELESYLLEASWCQYVSNSDLLGVFSRYRESLPQHLKTPEVVKTVAERLRVGTIVRVSIGRELRGLDLQLEVVGENGSDILFSERAVQDGDNLEQSIQQLRLWLDSYSGSIPYDGKVSGILGDQITVEVSKGFAVEIGQEFTVKRLRKTKLHPLLKKVVEWEAKNLATGTIFNLSDNQALGLVKVYKTDEKLEVGDWVKLGVVKSDKEIDRLRQEEARKDTPGKLGIASIYFTGSNSSISSSTGNTKRVEGNTIGFNGRLEGWVTRNWIGLFEFYRALGSFTRSSGGLEEKMADYQRGSIKAGGGYKYLAQGFFAGPQVDFFGGLANHTFKPDYSEPDGFGTFGYTGFFAGVGTNFPLGRRHRGVVRAEFMPFAKFDDTDSLYGSASNTSFFQLEFGGRYHYDSRMSFDCLLELTSTKSQFNGTVKSLSTHDAVLKLGASQNF